MRISFIRLLLITSLLSFFACSPGLMPQQVEMQNIVVSGEQCAMDSTVVKLYLPYKEKLEKDMNRVISVADVEMQKGRPESPLTNFLADVILAEARKEAKSQNLDGEPAVSFFNYGGIRVSSLPKGEITVGKIFELMPFENHLVLVKVDGKTMQKFLDFLARGGGDSVAGVRFKIDGDKAVDVSIGGSPLDPDKSYWLATNDYVAGGGDGFDVLKDNQGLVKVNLKIRDMIIRHLEEKQKNKETLHAQKDGRIEYVK